MIDDNYLFPFGKYKGQKLANVPASYILYAYNQNWLKGELREYVENNFNDLTIEKDRDEK